jgi:hypothetical protein
LFAKSNQLKKIYIQETFSYPSIDSSISFKDIQRFKDGGADRVLMKPLTKAKLMMGVLEYRLFPCVEEMTP